MKNLTENNFFIAIIFAIGLLFYSCSNGTTDTHTWGEWTITTYPTSTTNGVETRTCIDDPSLSETRNLTLAAFQTYFYGKWCQFWDENWVLTVNSSPNWELYKITSTNVQRTSSFDAGATYNIAKFDFVDNSDELTKVEYHSGFDITFDDLSSVSVFINSNKNSIMYQAEKLYKQP